MEIFHEGNPVEGRSCGTCAVCCNVMKIIEVLDKPNYVDCKHLIQIGERTEGACGIYENRPGPCRGFECLWRSGHFGRDEDRPDKLGVMFVAVEERMGNYEYHLTAWLVNKSIMGLERIKYLFEKIAKIRPLAIRSDKEYWLMGKAKELQRIKAQMERNSGNGNVEVKLDQ